MMKMLDKGVCRVIWTKGNTSRKKVRIVIVIMYTIFFVAAENIESMKSENNASTDDSSYQLSGTEAESLYRQLGFDSKIQAVAVQNTEWQS